MYNGKYSDGLFDNISIVAEEDARIQYLGTNPSSSFPILSLIFVSFVGHCLIFYFLPSSFGPFVKSYIISTVHACVCVLTVCIYFARSSINLTQVNRILGGGIKDTNDEMMTYSICYSGGYFIYDLLVMLYFKSVRTQSALIHHVIIFIAEFSGGVYTRVAHASHFYLLAEELSTIPLNLKTIYRERPRIRDFCACLFLITFVLSRLIYGTIITSYSLRAVPRFIRMASKLGDTTSILFVTAQVLLCILTRLLNLYWIVLILRKLNDPFKTKKPPVPTTSEESNKKAL